jgi:hypothetical protein
MNQSPQPSTATLQVDELRLDSTLPVVICDVDEVVVHFIAGLERYLERNGMWLDPSSFALNGNVRYRDTHDPVTADDLRPHFDRFFTEEVHRLEVIDGASDALASLAASANVVMLTNLPDKFRSARQHNLAANGIPYPVITNQGPKGPAARAIAERTNGRIVFVDDIPNYLNSVREHCAHAHLIHFAQDERFARHLEPLDYVSLRTDNWPHAHDHIAELLTGQ